MAAHRYYFIFCHIFLVMLLPHPCPLHAHDLLAPPVFLQQTETNKLITAALQTTPRILPPENKSFAATEEMNLHLKMLIGLLSQREIADYLIVCGNDDIDLMQKVLDLFTLSCVKKGLCLTGGYGRLTVPLIKNALAENFTIEIAPGIKLTTPTDELFQKISRDTTAARQLIQVSEAEIVKQIMLQMIERDPRLSPAEKMYVRKNLLRELILETTSTNTFENLANLKQIISLSGNIIVAQMSLQELRAWATARRVFEQELKTGNLQLWRFTNAFNTTRVEQSWLIQTVAAEMWRLIIYTAKGDLLLELSDELIIPAFYWESVRYLFIHSGEQEEIRAFLRTLAHAAGFSDKSLLYQRLRNNILPGIAQIIEWVYQNQDARGNVIAPAAKQQTIAPLPYSVRATEKIQTSL